MFGIIASKLPVKYDFSPSRGFWVVWVVVCQTTTTTHKARFDRERPHFRVCFILTAYLEWRCESPFPFPSYSHGRIYIWWTPRIHLVHRNAPTPFSHILSPQGNLASVGILEENRVSVENHTSTERVWVIKRHLDLVMTTRLGSIHTPDSGPDISVKLPK